MDRVLPNTVIFCAWILSLCGGGYMPKIRSFVPYYENAYGLKKGEEREIHKKGKPSRSLI